MGGRCEEGRMGEGIPVMVWFAGLAATWLLLTLVAMPLAWGGTDASGGILWP